MRRQEQIGRIRVEAEQNPFGGRSVWGVYQLPEANEYGEEGGQVKCLGTYSTKREAMSEARERVLLSKKIREGLHLSRLYSPPELNEMTPKEERIIDKERKQIRAFLATIRTENNAIGEGLAGIIRTVGAIRASQLGIDLMITELEAKLGNK